jgi:hypothetical protein
MKLEEFSDEEIVGEIVRRAKTLEIGSRKVRWNAINNDTHTSLFVKFPDGHEEWTSEHGSGGGIVDSFIARYWKRDDELERKHSELITSQHQDA